MASYYVDGTNGSDSADGTSWETAWQTIQKAISTVSTGTHHDVYVAAGTYAETTYNFLSITRDALDVSLIASGGTVTLSPSNTSYAIYLSVQTGSVSFDGFAITTAASRIIRHDGHQHLTLSNCTLTGTGNNSGIYLNTASGTQVRQLTIDNCTITFPRNVIIVSGADSVTIRNSDIRCTGNYVNTLLQGDIRAVSITGNTLAAPGNWLVEVAGATRITNCEQFVFDNNTAGVTTTARGGLSIDDGITNVRAIGNHLVLSHAETCYDALHIGVQDQTTETTIEHAVIANNFVRFAGAANSHCIRLGENLLSGEVSGNVAIGGDFQMVFKSENVYAHHNILVGASTVHFSDGGWNKFDHNTCICTSGNAIHWGLNNDGDPAVTNTMANNILVCTGSGVHCLYDQVGEHRNNRVDYNCYWPLGQSSLAILNGTAYSSLAALQTKWATYSPLWPDNDIHSMVADPQLANLSAFLDATNYWPLLTDWVTVRTLAEVAFASSCRGAASDQWADIGARQRHEMPTTGGPTDVGMQV